MQKIHGNQLISVDGTKWNVQSSDITQRGRHKSENVFSAKTGPKNKARMQITHESAKSALMLLIDNEMLQEILNCTVKEAKAQGNYQWELTAEELLAFMGLIGAKNIPLDDLWSKDWGNRLFSETMPRNRFREILRFIRFDDRRTRATRLVDDKFALFSYIWNCFISNCKSAYVPEENLTIDEQLFPTKSRCRFTQYMPNKPGKFGIKFWLMHEVNSKYLVNGFPYLGKDSDRIDVSLGKHVVLKLMKDYLNRGYNKTADKFFTSLPLVKTLRENKTGRHNRPNFLFGEA